MELTNNTILITGGTSGFGYEFASRLIDMGNTVIITGRDQAKLDLTKKKLPLVYTFQSDVSDPIAIKKLCSDVITQFPSLNIIINNAGEMRKINLQDDHIDLDNIVSEIDINLSGPIRMLQAFLPHLKTKASAAIINVTSGLALTPFPISPVYGATKAGLRSYTKSLRVQLRKTNIKVFELVAPGANTPLNDKFTGEVDSKSLMQPDKLIDVAIKGIMKDKFEIFPGLARIMYILSRLAPGIIFGQLSKITEKWLAKTNS